jgi:hypothetical protein
VEKKIKNINGIVDLFFAIFFLAFGMFTNIRGIARLLYIMASVIWLISSLVRIFLCYKK